MATVCQRKLGAFNYEPIYDLPHRFPLSYLTNLKYLSYHTFNIFRRLLALSKERVEHNYMH